MSAPDSLLDQTIRMRSPARFFRSQGEGFRHVATLATWSSVAQFIALALLPILTRLYTPEDFGVFALYTGLVGILGPIICWRYEFAVPFPETDSDAASVVAVSALAATMTSLVLLAIVFWFGEEIAVLVGMVEIRPWLWVIPLNLLVIGLFNSLSYWATRQKAFQRLAMARLSHTSTAGGFQAVVGSLSAVGSSGLILGSVVGNFVSLLFITQRTIVSDHRKLLNFSGPSPWRLAIRYRQLAVFAIPTAFLNAVSTFALPLLVAYFFGAFAAGVALLAQRLILLPLSLFVSAIWQVTHARIARVSYEHRRSMLKRIHRAVAFLIAFPLACVAGLSQYSGSLLGDEWQQVERILPAIVLMAFVNAVSNSTSYFAAFGEYRAEVITNVFLVSIRFGLLAFGAQWFDAYTAINFFALGSAFLYLAVNFFWGVRLGLVGRFISNLVHSAGLSVVVVALIDVLAQGSLLATCAMMVVAGAVYAFYVHRRVLPDGLVQSELTKGM